MIETKAPGGGTLAAVGSEIGALDVRALHRRAIVCALDTLRSVRSGQMDLPTPCAGWDLRDLIGHMVAENRGFVAAAGGSTEPDAWRDDSLGDDPWVDFATTAVDVVAALAGDEVSERRLLIREFGSFPGSVAIAMHFVDNLVHAWDVARTIGAPDAIDPELALIALSFAERWKLGKPGGAFGGAVGAPADATPGERLVALLGRTPDRRAA
ncbi:TIGR03086 family metal-binding protein [Embleya sp. NPDC001921]